jgi:demethoxyubiquinone hydroxylase (CLK1/Coq7/Cat5 family)
MSKIAVKRTLPHPELTLTDNSSLTSIMRVSRAGEIGGKVTQQRWGATDRGEYRHAAGAIAEAIARGESDCRV